MRFLITALFISAIFSSCEPGTVEKSSMSAAISEPIKREKIKVISDTDQKFITERMNRFVRRRRYNGSIIIAKDNEIVYDTVNGYANVRRRVPLTDTSAIQLASITKPITASVVMLSLIHI